MKKMNFYSRFMKKKYGPLFLLLCVLLMTVIWLTSRNSNSPPSSSDGNQTQWKAAPQFELPDAAQKLHRLAEFQGKVMILHFWASWCAPCIDEIPQWVELANRYRNKPLQLIAVSLDQKWSDAQKILPQEKLNNQILSLLDVEGRVPELFGTFQYPETYLISPDLKVVLKWVGSQDWNSAQMNSLIDKMLKVMDFHSD